MLPISYAGIGARKTPPRVLDTMREIAAVLSHDGWHLHSGGARGADTAFALGAPLEQRTLFLPWNGYNGHNGEACRSLSTLERRDLEPIAKQHHPAWNRCSAAVRKLHTRNVAILLGVNASSPVHAVLCWTEGGAITGGTGMGIRIAHSRRIPVFNLAITNASNILIDINRIVSRRTPVTSPAPEPVHTSD